MAEKPTYKELEKRIKEFEQEERVLRESKEMWRSLTENIPSFITVLDKDHKVLYLNKTYKKHTMQQVVGTKFTDYIATEHCEIVKDKVERVFKTGRSVTFENRGVGPDDEFVWYENYLAPIDRQQPFKRIIFISQNITDHKLAQSMLLKSKNELESKTKNLEELNAALNVLLNKRQEDKKALEDSILSNVRTLIEPYLAKLKVSKLHPKQETLLNILESNLNEIISPFTSNLTSKYLNLTPKEIEIANLVRHGKSSKEIAEIQGLASKTIAGHRELIRKKLGLTNKKINLKTYLQTLL